MVGNPYRCDIPKMQDQKNQVSKNLPYPEPAYFKNEQN
jgi:hypothetical protein